MIDFLRRIQGADEFIEGKAATVQGLKAIDRYTLQLALKEPPPL